MFGKNEFATSIEASGTEKEKETKTTGHRARGELTMLGRIPEPPTWLVLFIFHCAALFGWMYTNILIWIFSSVEITLN